ncbi:MAG: NAD-dependent epimerase/dehydratase family protein, partial [bacterium]
MVLLLTGGTGFFGKALLRYWLECHSRGNATPDVTVLSRSPESFLGKHPEFFGQPWLRLHRGDILQPSTFPTNATFTHVLHAAADSTFGPQLTPLERYTQIVDGTRYLLDYAVAHDIPRFLLTSSGGVYGPQPQDLEQMPEGYNGMPDPLNAQHAYSVAKRCAEHLCALYQDRHGLQTIVARCFAFVGRDLPLNVHFAIGNFIRDALTAPEITVGGDGTPVRSYMDQRDLAQWLVALLEYGRAGQAYNVGSDAAVSISELARLVRDTLAPDKPVRITGSPSAQNFRNRYVPSITKARTELGLELS